MASADVIRQRLSELRDKMRDRDVTAVLIPTGDPHCSEYTGDYYGVRKFFSGFTGSQGTLVVELDKASLWVDGRYFVQADMETEDTGIIIQKMQQPGVPEVDDYLARYLYPGDRLAFDGRILPASTGLKLEKKLKTAGIMIDSDFDPAEGIWNDRPERSHEPVYVLDLKYAGRTVDDKLSELREKFRSKGAFGTVICSLDDIMWLLNIRGNDIKCNPVAYSYMYVDENRACIFLQKEALNTALVSHLRKNQIALKAYDTIDETMGRYVQKGLDKNSDSGQGQVNRRLLMDKSCSNYKLYTLLRDNDMLVEGHNPTQLMKALKNDGELQNIRETYLKDSLCLTRFIKWLKENVSNKESNKDSNKDSNEEITELSAAEKLDGMRAELEEYISLSFNTISAYGPNAAMMHYSPGKEKVVLEPKGFYLVDSGGQYYGGTTDVTRTVVLGEVTDEMKRHFTLTAMGMLRLASARFLEGCTGKNVDILAREPLWNEGIDYKCGTGHGIGFLLNVHEGPHNIRWRFAPDANEAPLMPGMIVSDEPGVYREGMYGIRTENILEVTADIKTSDGQFMGFKHLTMVPIDLDAIDPEVMTSRDRRLLNEYHAMVFEKLSPFMDEEEKAWLREQTRAI